MVKIMIIKNLRLENFKSHSQTIIDFNTGISIIMGENGAGKSSILEAISFALFKQYTGRTLQHLVRSGQERMKVELDFMVNGRNYRVVRERTKSASRASLQISEGSISGAGFQTILSGDKQVNQEIQNLLEMDGDLFLNAVYVRQGEIADLIEKTQSEKKQLIGKLLGIESLEKAWKNMMPLIKDYEAQKENYKGRLESMGDLKQELKTKNAEKKDIEAKILQARQKITEVIMEREKIKKDKDEMDNQQVIFQQVQSLITIKNNLLNTAQSREKELLNELANMEAQEKLMQEMEPEINRLDSLIDLKSLLADINSLEIEKKGIEEAITKINKYEKILSEKEPSYEEYNSIQEKVKEISQEKSQFAGARDVLETKRTHQSQLQDKIKKLQQTISQLFQEANTALGSQLDNWEELEKLLEKTKKAAEIKISSLDREMGDIKQQISSLQGLNQSIKKPLSELKLVEDQCPVCKSDIDENKKQELLKSYQAEMDNNNQAITNLTFSLENLIAQRDDLTSQSTRINAINLAILKGKIESHDSLIKEMDEIEGEMEKLVLEVSKLEELEANINSKEDRLKEIKEDYNAYIKAQGVLDSSGDLGVHQESLELLESMINSKNQEISQLSTLAGVQTLDNDALEGEISRLKELNNKYQQIKGSIDNKESLDQTLLQVRASIKENIEYVNKYTKSLENVSYDAEIHQNLTTLFENKSQELMDINGKEKEFNGELKGVLMSIQKLEEELGKYEGYKSELSSLQDFIKLLKYFRDLFGKDGIQKELRNISRPLIEQNTREFFDKFNFEYSDISLDEDYNIEVYGPVGKTSLDMISGGERIAVALALRLGITKALSGGNLELIMLDEPTIHLDTYRRQELIDILKRMSIIPQMIIVTHDADLEEAADNIIKVKKEEGDSQVILDEVDIGGISGMS